MLRKAASKLSDQMWYRAHFGMAGFGVEDNHNIADVNKKVKVIYPKRELETSIWSH
jgi:hypothetical protein